MGELWGLSGAAFDWLFIGGFLLALILKAAVPPWVCRTGSTVAADAEPHAYWTAYLEGGSSRVADTAVVAMAGQGHIVVAGDGAITPVAGATVLDPIEAAIHQELAAPGPHSSLSWDLRRHPAMLALRTELLSHGLLINGARLWPYRLALLFPVAAWITGLVRAINAPGAFLIILLVITAIILLIAVFAEIGSDDRVSTAGRRYRRRAREIGVPAPSATPRDTTDDTPRSPNLIAVAAYGFSAVADPTLRRALLATRTGRADGTPAG